MLNISKTSVSQQILSKNYSTLTAVEQKKSSKVFRRIIYVILLLSIIFLMLPWTQNIRSNGTITALKPDQKPQSLTSIIAGQINQWYVKEGDFVQKGDTILKINETKDAYFDNQLLPRTNDQVNLKRESILTYGSKIETQEQQLALLKTQRDLKLSQLRIKIQQTQLKQENDSIAFIAAQINNETAINQYNRQDSLYQLGLKSLTDLEKRNLKLQQTRSYSIEAKNKWLNTKNDLINLSLELNSLELKYQSEFNKVQSNKFSTISAKLEAETHLSKLENQYSNYAYRNGLYYITAPQDGYITKTTSSGIGETIKEGQEILTLMPRNYDLAVEMYIEPIDLPLIQLNQHVRIQFDGWPAIIFSGWPQASHGTYGGVVYAIDQFISSNGKYRVLVAPDEKDIAWPDALRFGSGTSTMVLLNDVPIWYELWRKINGFPPEYYTSKDSPSSTKKK